MDISFDVVPQIVSFTLGHPEGEISIEIDSTPIEMTVGQAISFEINGQGVIHTIYSTTKLEKEFTYADWGLTKKLIGKAESSLRISKVSLVIESGEEFDAGTVVIGDELAHGRLMTAGMNNLIIANQYHHEPDYKYGTDTNLYIYFETGTPSMGEGLIIIYLQ